MSKINHNDQLTQTVALRGVGKRYSTPERAFSALTGVNLTLLPGEHVAIMGRSGSGKSTLLNMLTGSAAQPASTSALSALQSAEPASDSDGIASDVRAAWSAESGRLASSSRA